MNVDGGEFEGRYPFMFPGRVGGQLRSDPKAGVRWFLPVAEELEACCPWIRDGFGAGSEIIDGHGAGDPCLRRPLGPGFPATFWSRGGEALSERWAEEDAGSIGRMRPGPGSGVATSMETIGDGVPVGVSGAGACADMIAAGLGLPVSVGGSHCSHFTMAEERASGPMESSEPMAGRPIRGMEPGGS